MDVLALGCRAALIVVFGLAVAGKLRGRASWDAFVVSLAALGVPSSWPAAPAAAAIVGLEAVAVLLLVAVPAPGLALAAGLLAVFTAALGLALRRGVRTPCRCFGASERPLGPAHLARNGILLALAVGGVAGATLSPGLPGLQASISALLVGGTAGLLVARWDDLLFLFTAGLARSEQPAPRRR